MVTLGEILKPRHVSLDLAAADSLSGISQLAEVLQGDPRVTNWSELRATLRDNANKGLTILSCGAALCHARTEGVGEMLMAAARLVAPIVDQPVGRPPGAEFRYLFIIGLPPAMAADYLRVVGALARTLKDDSTIPLLEATSSAEEFVSILSQAELAL